MHPYVLISVSASLVPALAASMIWTREPAQKANRPAATLMAGTPLRTVCEVLSNTCQLQCSKRNRTIVMAAESDDTIWLPRSTSLMDESDWTDDLQQDVLLRQGSPERERYWASEVRIEATSTYR